MTKVWNHLLVATLLAGSLAAPAAAVQTRVGQAIHEDFETYAPGPQSFSFCDLLGDDCLGILSGGSVMAAAGTQVYGGTSLVFNIPNPIDYSWPAVYLSLSTGDSAVQFRVFDFDPDDLSDVEIFSLLVPALTANFRIGIGTELAPVYLTRFTLQAATPFAIDDLQLGLENVSPGIPEPASWLMMILGFGAIGAGLRLQRQADLRRQRFTV